MIWGNVTQVGEQGGCLARSAVLLSDLPEHVPGLVAQPLLRLRPRGGEPRRQPGARGAGGGYVAGGVEMMSRVPMGSDGAAIAVDPALAFKTYFVPQGISADIIATEFGFSRDDVDAYAVESQKRAARAWDEGRFARSSSRSPTSTACRSSTATSTCAPAPTCSRSARSSPPSRTWARPCPASTPWRS